MTTSRLKKIYKNLKYKYRLVIYNESTFETEYSLYLSKLNVLLLASTVLVIGMLLSILLISFTSLKYYMPGIGEDAMRKQLRDLVQETDELRRKTKENDLWVENIKQVLKGEIPANKIQLQENEAIDSNQKK
ncbi:MAG: hypothetical protein JNL75_04810 [Chitinophagales bacterium]|nr:hypothetical protein [Chitinophagales bacterium]